MRGSNHPGLSQHGKKYIQGFAPYTHLNITAGDTKDVS